MPSVVRADTVEREGAQHPYLAHWLQSQDRPGDQMGHPVNLQRADEREIRQIRATYCGLISEVDYHLGRVLAYLRANGEWDDTLVVFTADHGEMLGDHWLFGKGGYFDACYHVPMIVRDPRRPAGHGSRVDAFTEAVDIMPTILEWLELDTPTACDGRSLVPLMDPGVPVSWRGEAHWAFDFREPVTRSAETALGLTSDQCTLNVIRDHRFKYVHFAALPPLLFDLDDDPHEFRNLAGDPAYQGRLLDYAQKLLSWRMRHEERVLSNTLLTPDGVHSGFPSRW
jgi:arylsulfatase A-like enzyme